MVRYWICAAGWAKVFPLHGLFWFLCQKNLYACFIFTHIKDVCVLIINVNKLSSRLSAFFWNQHVHRSFRRAVLWVPWHHTNNYVVASKLDMIGLKKWWLYCPKCGKRLYMLVLWTLWPTPTPFYHQHRIKQPKAPKIRVITKSSEKNVFIRTNDINHIANH